MEYKEQKLIKWWLNTWFNTIHNCEIVRPTWNGVDSYWQEFFIEKRKPLCLEYTVWVGEITDIKTIDNVEYILVKNWTSVQLKYKSSSNPSVYTNLWSARIITENVTPLHILKWTSGIWEQLATWVTIWDAFYDLYYKGIYTSPANDTTTYITNNIVEYLGIKYVSLSWSIWKLPTDKTYWSVYNDINSWATTADPSSILYTDTFAGWYFAIKLIWTWIRAIVSAINSTTKRYILFNEWKSNLAWVCSEIYYIKTEVWSPPNEAVVYIRWTNQAWSRPDLKWTETVKIVNDSWWVPIIASNTWVHSYNLVKDWSWLITWVTEIDLLKIDLVTDMCLFNGSLFVLNNKTLYYSKSTNKGDSDINIYPNSFINVKWGTRCIPFWKMLIVFWENNKVITPINWTTGNIWFVGSDLTYNKKLLSKYSVTSNMWMLYLIQEDKQLVKVDVTQINNISYQIETTTVLETAKWIIDNIGSIINMGVDSKELYITDYRNSKTYVYKYNVEYQHWSTYDYWYKINYIENNRFFWNNIYNIVGTALETNIEQKVWFVLWSEDLYKLKQLVFIKIIFWIKDKILDYNLDIEYEIGWKIMYKTIDLTSYKINTNIYSINNGNIWLWDTLIWTSLLGSPITNFEEKIWTFVSVNIWVWRLWSLFRFTLKSKNWNEFTYWWSVAWFISDIPEVTEMWYKH